jgi:hypothetical protein
MSAISKQALLVDNNESFPNNNAGAITPSDLRAFNVNVIDSTVNQTEYTTNSGSWNVAIGQLNAFTASQQPSFTALNSFTSSQLTINSGVNSFTQSAGAELDSLSAWTGSWNAWTSSLNEIRDDGVLQGYSTRFFFNGLVSASIVQNVDGAIANVTVEQDGTKLNTASFNAYTASTAASQSVFSSSVATSISSSNTAFNVFSASQNSFNLSATASLVELLNLSSSLSGGYATQGELDQSASVLQANIDTKLNTASFNAYTQSFSQSVATDFSASYAYTNSSILLLSSSISSSSAISDNAQTARINSLSSLTGSYATTGSNTFVGNQTVNGTTRLVGNLTITGSVFGNVSASTITSQTASIDLSTTNYFTLTLSGTTRINVINPTPGVTATLVINTDTAASASFSSNVKQPSGSLYAASPSGNVDIISFTAVDSNTVYAFPAQSFV